MHIVLGIVLLALAVIFVPGLVALAAGIAATFWAAGLIVAALTIIVVLYKPVMSLMRKPSVAKTAFMNGEMIGPAQPFMNPTGYGPKRADPFRATPAEVTTAKAVNVCDCASCGKSIKRHGMFCPFCGKDPRAKR